VSKAPIRIYVLTFGVETSEMLDKVLKPAVIPIDWINARTSEI